MMNRRNFLTGIIAAPAIVRPTSLMIIKPEPKIIRIGYGIKRTFIFPRGEFVLPKWYLDFIDRAVIEDTLVLNTMKYNEYKALS